MTKKALAENPKTAELIMLAEQGKFEQKEPTELNELKAPGLEKGKIFEVWATCKIFNMENSAKIENQRMSETAENMAYKITEAKFHDEIFIETGLENDDFEKTVKFHVKRDPDFKKKLN